MFSFLSRLYLDTYFRNRHQWISTDSALSLKRRQIFYFLYKIATGGEQTMSSDFKCLFFSFFKKAIMCRHNRWNFRFFVWYCMKSLVTWKYHDEPRGSYLNKGILIEIAWSWNSDCAMLHGIALQGSFLQFTNSLWPIFIYDSIIYFHAITTAAVFSL